MTLDTKLLDTLDKYLKIYFDPGAYEGEKNNSISLFRKRCIKNGIDPDEYIKTSSANPANKNKRSRNSRDSGFKQKSYEEYTREQEDEREREMRWRERAERARRQQARQQSSSSSSSSRYAPRLFEMKEPMGEKRVHNGKTVILLSGLARKTGTFDRYGIQNFCIYSEGFDPGVFNSTDLYEVETSGQVYFRDHYLVTAMWVVKGDSKVRIY